MIRWYFLADSELGFEIKYYIEFIKHLTGDSVESCTYVYVRTYIYIKCRPLEIVLKYSNRDPGTKWVLNYFVWTAVEWEVLQWDVAELFPLARGIVTSDAALHNLMGMERYVRIALYIRKKELFYGIIKGTYCLLSLNAHKKNYSTGNNKCNNEMAIKLRFGIILRFTCFFLSIPSIP